MAARISVELTNVVGRDLPAQTTFDEDWNPTRENFRARVVFQTQYSVTLSPGGREATAPLRAGRHLVAGLAARGTGRHACRVLLNNTRGPNGQATL